MFTIFVRGSILLVSRSYRKSKWSGLSRPQCLLITENHFRSRTKVTTKNFQFRGLPLPPQMSRYPLRVLTMLIYRFSGGSGVLGFSGSYFRSEIIPTKFHSYSSIFHSFHPIGSSREDWVNRGPPTGLPPLHIGALKSQVNYRYQVLIA